MGLSALLQSSESFDSASSNRQPGEGSNRKARYGKGSNVLWVGQTEAIPQALIFVAIVGQRSSCAGGHLVLDETGIDVGA